MEKSMEEQAVYWLLISGKAKRTLKNKSPSFGQQVRLGFAKHPTKPNEDFLQQNSHTFKIKLCRAKIEVFQLE